MFIVPKLLKRDNVGEYHIFTAQKEDRFCEDHHVRRCPIFRPKSSEYQKKKSPRPRADARAVYLRAERQAFIRGGGGAKFETKHKNRCLQKSKLVTWGGASMSIGGQPPLAPTLSRPQMFNSPPKIKCRPPKKGYYVRRCPIFRPKSNEDQKKVITFAGRSLF